MNVRQQVRGPIRSMPRKASGHHSAGPQKANARNRILNAVLAITKKSGVGHLSLEAIARQAGVSKGGLLYHFPTKKTLMRALVEHHVALTEQAIADAEAEERSPNAVATALVEVCRKFFEVPRPQTRDGSLAAFVEDPSLFDPVRAHHQRVADRIRSSATDPDLSLIALLALEGIKAHDVLALDFLTKDERRRVLAVLAELLRKRG